MSVNPTGTLVQRIGERFKTALQESSDFRGDLSVVIDYHAEVASEVRALLQRRFEALADPLHERTRGVHTHLARLNAGATTQPSGGTLDQRFTADLALELDDGVQQGLRTRGTARQVNVDGDDLVHALDDRVVVEHPGG